MREEGDILSCVTVGAVSAGCWNLIPGGNTWRMSAKDILRFGKFGNGGRPPGKDIKPGIVGVGLTDRGSE